MNRDQPVKIESSTLEVRDKQRQATFSGGVTLTQGETILKCKTLVVFYEDTAMAPGKKGAPRKAPPQAQKGGRRTGGAADQARGSEGRRLRDPEGSDRERRQRRVRSQGQYHLMTGNVVLTQGPQVMRGEQDGGRAGDRVRTASRAASK